MSWSRSHWCGISLRALFGVGVRQAVRKRRVREGQRKERKEKKGATRMEGKAAAGNPQSDTAVVGRPVEVRMGVITMCEQCT